MIMKVSIKKKRIDRLAKIEKRLIIIQEAVTRLVNIEKAKTEEIVVTPQQVERFTPAIDYPIGYIPEGKKRAERPDDVGTNTINIAMRTEDDEMQYGDWVDGKRQTIRSKDFPKT